MRGLLFDVYCKFFVTGHSVAIKLLLRRTLVLGTMKRQVMKIRFVAKAQDAKHNRCASILRQQQVYILRSTGILQLIYSD